MAPPCGKSSRACVLCVPLSVECCNVPMSSRALSLSLSLSRLSLCSHSLQGSTPHEPSTRPFDDFQATRRQRVSSATATDMSQSQPDEERPKRTHAARFQHCRRPTPPQGHHQARTHLQDPGNSPHQRLVFASAQRELAMRATTPPPPFSCPFAAPSHCPPHCPTDASEHGLLAPPDGLMPLPILIPQPKPVHA